MNLNYNKATNIDIEHIYRFTKQQIDTYEKVLSWVRKKIENRIEEYIVIYENGEKAGYYRFYRNEEGEYEIDDLYIFPEFQNKGIGLFVINKCCCEVNNPVILYVFIRNDRAVSLYKRLGFEVVKNINDSRYIMKK